MVIGKKITAFFLAIMLVMVLLSNKSNDPIPYKMWVKSNCDFILDSLCLKNLYEIKGKEWYKKSSFNFTITYFVVKHSDTCGFLLFRLKNEGKDSLISEDVNKFITKLHTNVVYKEILKLRTAQRCMTENIQGEVQFLDSLAPLPKGVGFYGSFTLRFANVSPRQIKTIERGR